MNRPQEPVVSRSSESPAAPRRFGRRAPGIAHSEPSGSMAASPMASASLPHTPMHGGPASSAAPRQTYDPPPFPPRAEPADKLIRPGVPLMKRVIGLLLFVGGVSVIYFMQSSTGGLPGCGAYDTRNMLAGMARDVLAKSNVGYSRIDIAQATSVPADNDGVIKCTAQLVIDGQPHLRLVYEISWSVRLAVYNRWQVKVVSATP